ncbi:hypothetical protein BDP55DRAFT_23537 [Colletotrichum godetiae]|uniref:Uncharacterized protein n=1 Tax=Colletotrichum godetiae TaxID=1209918 RepID=A0AAJ0B4K9_9PEZI|nr:uncharacterized protein BDP55DRAFT_23537 [Colletotrichum godetiae]KAK1701544.1 hypothetical protein BDP55DRAFT_23537 [Colletotrichum godetiae]
MMASNMNKCIPFNAPLCICIRSLQRPLFSRAPLPSASLTPAGPGSLCPFSFSHPYLARWAFYVIHKRPKKNPLTQNARHTADRRRGTSDGRTYNSEYPSCRDARKGRRQQPHVSLFWG